MESIASSKVLQYVLLTFQIDYQRYSKFRSSEIYQNKEFCNNNQMHVIYIVIVFPYVNVVSQYGITESR